MAHATTSIVRCWLVRHAIAEPRGPAWPDDRLRPLTPRGVRRMAQVIDGLGRAGIGFDLILTSPLVRTRHTADLLRSGVDAGRRPPVVEIEVLAPGHEPEATVRMILARARGVRDVAVVGHEPGLGRLLAWLLDPAAAVPAAAPFVFRKGGVARVDVDRRSGRGQLVWFAPPRLLRRLR